MTKLNIKTGDRVRVISGKDKDKEGEVLKVIPEKGRVVVKNVAIVKRHMRPTQANPNGGISEREAAIDASNVMFYDKDAKKATRIGHKIEDGKKVRVSKKTGKVID